MISSPKRKSCAIEQVRRENDALFLTAQRGTLRLSPVSDSILRVTYTELPAFSEEKSLGICCNDRFSHWEHTETEDTIALILPKFTAMVDRRSGTIRYIDHAGNLLLRERDHESHDLYYFDSYKTVVDENKNDGIVVSPHTSTYYGNGGIYQPYIGLAWKPFSWISAGVTGSYIYGDITHDVTGSFSNSTVISNSYSANIKSYKVDFGLQFIAKMAPKHTLTLGTTYSLGHDMHVTATQTKSNSGESTTTEIPNGFKLPHTYGAGFFYSYNNQWGFGADYTLEQWNGSTFFGKETGVGTDRSKISIGAEYSPAELSRNLFKMMSYRAGVHYAQPYTEIGGKKGCNEYGISAGVSIPFFNKNNNYSHATLHISGQYIHMQPMSAGMITENYLRLNIGITFNENWFMKFRIR